LPHALTIFTMALFLHLWHPCDPHRRASDWIKLGLAAGLVAVVRWQDGVILVAPLAEIGFWYVQGRVGLAPSLRNLVALCAAALLVFLPQSMMWTHIYGFPLAVPQGAELFVWSSPHLVETLFSTRHGLISWHPIFLIALFGFPMLWRRSQVLACTAAFMFAAELYINASVTSWWADDAFGGRRFTGLVPLFVALLGSLIDVTARGWHRRALFAALAILVVWNGLSLVQYRAGFVAKDSALTLREMTVDRLLLPVEVLRRIAR
jgi:hypothetical protein